MKEEDNSVWSDEDAKRVNIFTSMGLIFIVGWVSFLLVTLAPSCPAHFKKPEYYYEQGKIESKKGNAYVAIKLFTRAIKIKSDYLEAYAERAKSNIEIDSVLNAISDYDSILAMNNLNVQQRGEYIYLKSYAHYLWFGYDSVYCRLVNEGCDKYGNNKCCDIRRIKCK